MSKDKRSKKEKARATASFLNSIRQSNHNSRSADGGFLDADLNKKLYQNTLDSIDKEIEIRSTSVPLSTPDRHYEKSIIAPFKPNKE